MSEKESKKEEKSEKKEEKVASPLKSIKIKIKFRKGEMAKKMK